ncbi:MAG: two-component system heavy metal sensor histidine kinase CusS [Rhodoferax sp.]|jgi:two-component system heavy metal sensor histidine kinase CusS
MLRRFSLTTRLTVLYALVSASVLLGMATIISMAVERHFIELDQATLGDKIHLVQDLVASARSPAELQTRLDRALQNHPGLLVRIDHLSGVPLYVSAAIDIPEVLLKAAVQSPTATFLTWHDGQQTYRALQASVPPQAILGRDLRIWAALDTLHHAHFIHSLQTVLWLYVVVAALLSGLLGWWVARTGLAPLRAMKAQAQAVTAHQLDQRMPAQAVPVEMADLAHSLNDMLARLQQDFQRLSEFSSDLAHELRTPISNLLTQTQVALIQPRDGATYRDILASNAEEFERLARMVSDMLLLAKAEHGLLLPHAGQIALADEVRALFDFYEALADEKGIQLQLVGAGHVTGDRLMLRRAISNLLSNALRHTPPQGQVRVEITDRSEAVGLSVENTGPEIAPEDLPRLFDRFFRADKSRLHLESEGAGLGLSITQAIVRFHGGKVSVKSAGGWTRFSLVFPRLDRLKGS